jgi:tetratricopeptide (TPR) repeat protein
MADEEVLEAIPIAEVVDGDSVAQAHFAECARILDRAVQGGTSDPNVLYMLALAYKRQGKTQEARTALRKITKPDANVILQMALLSLQEGNLVQAEGELQRAWEMDQTSYETCYNLLLTRLTLGKNQECLQLIPHALQLAQKRHGNSPSGVEEKRFLNVLQALLKSCDRDPDLIVVDTALTDMSNADEARLLKVIRSLGQLDTVHSLLRTLYSARPNSAAVPGPRPICCSSRWPASARPRAAPRPPCSTCWAAAPASPRTSTAPRATSPRP